MPRNTTLGRDTFRKTGIFKELPDLTLNTPEKKPTGISLFRYPYVSSLSSSVRWEATQSWQERRLEVTINRYGKQETPGPY